jgi:hypothetical protein
MKKERKPQWQGTFKAIKGMVPSKAIQLMKSQLDFRSEDYVFTVQITNGYLLVW